MRTRAVWCMAVLAIAGAGSATGYAQIGQNLLTNGGFESGSIAPYGTYGTVTPTVVTECEGATVPQGPIEGKYCLHVVVPAAGANNWDMGMTDGSHSFEQGKKYTFSCFMKTKSGTLQVRMKPERGADPWEAYTEAVVTVTDSDLPDLAVLPLVGFFAAPADAHPEVLRRADLTLKHKGGRGALRELCERLLADSHSHTLETL